MSTKAPTPKDAVAVFAQLFTDIADDAHEGAEQSDDHSLPTPTPEPDEEAEVRPRGPPAGKRPAPPYSSRDLGGNCPRCGSLMESRLRAHYDDERHMGIHLFGFCRSECGYSVRTGDVEFPGRS